MGVQHDTVLGHVQSERLDCFLDIIIIISSYEMLQVLCIDNADDLHVE